MSPFLCAAVESCVLSPQFLAKFVLASEEKNIRRYSARGSSFGWASTSKDLKKGESVTFA